MRPLNIGAATQSMSMVLNISDPIAHLTNPKVINQTSRTRNSLAGTKRNAMLALGSAKQSYLS